MPIIFEAVWIIQIIFFFITENNKTTVHLQFHHLSDPVKSFREVLQRNLTILFSEYIRTL